MKLKQKPKLNWWSSPRTLFRELLMLDDTSHSIALGTTIGMFIAMTPTVGIQMIIVVLVALLAKPFFKFNRMAALITVYVSNPLTTVPIYWFNYKVGAWFLGGKATAEQFSRVLEYEGFEQWWNTIVTLYVKFGYPLIIGSLIVATVCALPTYPVIYYLRNRFRFNKSELPSDEKTTEQLTEHSPTSKEYLKEESSVPCGSTVD